MSKRRNKICGADMHRDLIVATIKDDDNALFQKTFAQFMLNLKRLGIGFCQQLQTCSNLGYWCLSASYLRFPEPINRCNHGQSPENQEYPEG
jgi:hypothetical protein